MTALPDSSMPWSPVEIERKLQHVIARMDDMVQNLKGLAIRQAEAKRALRQAEAKAKAVLQFTESETLLRANADQPRIDGKKPTIDERKAWVVIETHEANLAYIEAVTAEQEAFDIADTEYQAARHAKELLMAEGDLLRTLARSSRDLHETFGRS